MISHTLVASIHPVSVKAKLLSDLHLRLSAAGPCSKNSHLPYRSDVTSSSWLRGRRVIKEGKGKHTHRATITAELCSLVTGTLLTLSFLQGQYFQWLLPSPYFLSDFSVIQQGGSSACRLLHWVLQRVWQQHCTGKGALPYMRVTAKTIPFLLVKNIHSVYYTHTYFILRFSTCFIFAWLVV